MVDFRHLLYKKKGDSETNISDSFVPTEEQEKAILKIKEMLDSKNEHIFVLKGYAGTGKTTIVNHILKDYKNKGEVIAVTAFTNKATNVISKKTPFADGITLFSLLGLRPVRNSEIIKFKQEKDSSLVKLYNIIVLDEVSMVLDENLDQLLQECQKYWHPIKLIIMGDPAQLPPVGQDTESKAFSFPNSFELVNVIRQSKYSNILKYSLAVRTILKEDKIVKINKKLKINEDARYKDLYVYDKSPNFIKSILEKFSCENYNEDIDYVKIIAYRNKTVEVLNKLVRTQLFGEKIEPICVGDQLILNSPAKEEDGYIVYDTSDEIKILSKDRTLYEEDHLGEIIRFPYYFCRTERVFDGKKGTIKIVDPDFYSDFDKQLNEWAKRIKNSYNSKTLFSKEFYPFKALYAKPSYNYALTTHKSQGSTYQIVYVVEDDIERVKLASNKNLWKSKYVAYTRASEELHILNRQ